MRQGLLAQRAWHQHLLHVVLGKNVIRKPVACLLQNTLLYALPNIILQQLDADVLVLLLYAMPEVTL